MVAKQSNIAATMHSAAPAEVSTKDRIKAIYALGKPNLSAMVVTTAVLGFYLAHTALMTPLSWVKAVMLVLGTGLTAAGACAANMYSEAKFDALMMRTRHRPIPSGIVSSEEALAYSLGTFLVGFALLYVFCGPLPAILSLFVTLVYAFVYTPMKRKGPLSIWVGAVTGALPPVMGWATVTGEIGWGGLSLFGILFSWQFPHFLALAYMYKDDYARGGFRFFPNQKSVDNAGKHIFYGSLVLWAFSFGPSLLGLTGTVFTAGAVLLGGFFSYMSWQAAKDTTVKTARKAFFASITYLPLLLALMVLDRILR